jgi:AraC-like DNA-binding protein
LNLEDTRITDPASKTGATADAPPAPRSPRTSAQLARLLADVHADLERLHGITRSAGYEIVFKDLSGAIIEYQGTADDGASGFPARGGLTPGALRRVRAYIEANLTGRIKLEDLAAIANLSRCYFAHAFKQSLGYTPLRYVMSCRLDKARDLVEGSDMPIAEIALATGFTDQSHFSRCFRAFYGIAPLAFRRSQRWESSDEHDIAAHAAGPDRTVADASGQTHRGRQDLVAA